MSDTPPPPTAPAPTIPNSKPEPDPESPNNSTSTSTSTAPSSTPASDARRHPMKCPISRIYHQKRELLLLLSFILLVATFCGTGTGIAIVAGMQGTPPEHRKASWPHDHGLLALGVVCAAFHLATMVALTHLAQRDSRRKNRRTLPWVGAAFGSCIVALVVLVAEELRRWGWANWATVWLLVCAGWLVCMGLECATGFWWVVVDRVARGYRRFRTREHFRFREGGDDRVRMEDGDERGVREE